MEKLRKSLILWRVLTLVSLLSILVGTPLLALFALRGLYVPMGIFIPIVAHGFYGLPFYFRAKRRRCVMLTYIELLENGVTDSADIADKTGLNELGQAKYLALMTKKGYYTK